MLTLRFWTLALAGASLVSTCPAAGFADTVVSYNSGTGFAAGFTSPPAALGAPTASANPFAPAFQKTQLVSLGAGGSLTVQFSTPLLNDPSHPYGLDFTIFGNAGFIITNNSLSGGGITDGSLLGNNTGSTRVSVSEDGVTYYTLNPALAPTVDGRFPTDGAGLASLPVNPSLTLSDFAGENLAGIRSLYGGSAGGGSFDISWAEDASGNPVSLAEINFVRVDVLSGKSEIDAFSAVPEPATSSLLLAGLALSTGRIVRPRPATISSH